MVYIAYMAAMAMTGEHPQDVLARIAFWQTEKRPCALVVITNTIGGAVRAPGALLAVSETSSFGYISGGCIDADVILQARQSLKDHKNRTLRYGAGSPFVDLPLPCGGAIDVLIVPGPDADLIITLNSKLAARQPVGLAIDANEMLSATGLDGTAPAGTNVYVYYPKLRLRIAGRGADALALAKVSDAAGYDTHLQLLDEDDAADARHAGLDNVEQLTSAAGLPALYDDAWTAFVLLFHDRDWEIPLLIQALEGPAFYIGAVGSRRTHDIRREALRSQGCTDDDIARIHGPIGLVPSLRDASAIALSTLAEIIQVDMQRASPATTSAKTALVLLAAGSSRRFEDGDKLLADYKGRKVLEHAAGILAEQTPARAIAVVGPDDGQRGNVLKDAGWELVENADASTGQASSLKCALAHLRADVEIDQMIILLGDMPNVPGDHIKQMIDLAESSNVRAIMTETGSVLSPPALFKRDQFEKLAEISGDRGAKSIFQDIAFGAHTLKLSAHEAIDIDCLADLNRAKETEHA